MYLGKKLMFHKKKKNACFMHCFSESNVPIFEETLQHIKYEKTTYCLLSFYQYNQSAHVECIKKAPYQQFGAQLMRIRR